MGLTWAGRLAAVFGVLGMASAVRAGDPASPTASASAAGAAASGPTVPAAPEATRPPAEVPGVERDEARHAAGAARLAAETDERIKQLDAASEKAPSSQAKALRAVLEERRQLLKDWSVAARAYQEARNPEESPEKLAADWKDELQRLKTRLQGMAKSPGEMLAPAFRTPAEKVTDALRAEMKDAIEDAKNELKEAKSKCDKLRAETGRRSVNALSALQIERDKIHQRVAANGPRRAEREAALASAKTDDERSLAAERLTNFEWEERLENERLRAQEARIALETKRADLTGLNTQVCEVRVQLFTRTLELMQARYVAITRTQERKLEKDAASEQSRARRSDDPLEQFQARWKATLLELEAQALKHENVLASSLPPSLEEQKSLADRAEVDYENTKRLLDDDLVSQLDAVRLNNDFRRIGPLRARIRRHELADTARLSAYYDNALTRAQMDLTFDRHADEYEHEMLLERLSSKAQREKAIQVFAEIDLKHRLLLERNILALEKLANRAEQTHGQVLRRLEILDKQYGFIRTHIFWVRDQEPIGATTLTQGERDLTLLSMSMIRLAMEAVDPRLWGRVSMEFLAGVSALVILAWPSLRLRRTLMRRSGESRRSGLVGAGVLVGILISVAYSAVWPTYLGLAAYTARQAPWPRSLAIPTSASLAMLAPAAFVAGLVRWMLRRGGWAEQTLDVPPEVTRQLRRGVFVLVLAGIPLLLPSWLLDQGLIAPSGRPIACSTLGQLLGLGFELTVWGVVFRLVRGSSPLVQWLLRFPERLGWLNRHRRRICWSVLAAIGGIIVLDALGYSYTARRLAIGAGQGLIVLGFSWGLYRMILQAIDHHAWRWIGVRHTQTAVEGPQDATVPDDLAHRLRRLTAYVVPVIGLMLAAWIWDVDWALFRFVGEQALWQVDADRAVTVGDFTRFALILGLTVAVWSHISTFFAVAVFPKMRDDPGVRFAVVTLCRYAVLGIGLLAGLSSIHLGLEKIGVVLAALGVGLGFGLQEIVSNFVCGIILLLERPIRVGDIVTVSGMTGKVERINIRATTITNGDNQSIIVPNRAFITSDLINWTLKDKVIRITIRVKVAHGTDPDRVSDLLLSIAREDPDVLRNPVPASFMEDFSESALNFVLHAHVPDPSLGSRVRHRLFSQIQRHFAEGGIEIPLPRQELRVQSIQSPAGQGPGITFEVHRVDAASPTPPAPRVASPLPVVPVVEDCHRGVDE